VHKREPERAHRARASSRLTPTWTGRAGSLGYAKRSISKLPSSIEYGVGSKLGCLPGVPGLLPTWSVPLGISTRSPGRGERTLDFVSWPVAEGLGTSLERLVESTCRLQADISNIK
jgi:hypothetical protein